MILPLFLITIWMGGLSDFQSLQLFEIMANNQEQSLPSIILAWVPVVSRSHASKGDFLCTKFCSKYLQTSTEARLTLGIAVQVYTDWSTYLVQLFNFEVIYF